MRVARLTIENFRGVAKAVLHFSGHALLIGGNNVGKSTVREALDHVLGPDRLNRTTPAEDSTSEMPTAGLQMAKRRFHCA